jgi:hypothetical protein
MPRFAEIFINEADGKPLDEILQRVEDAVRPGVTQSKARVALVPLRRHRNDGPTAIT